MISLVSYLSKTSEIARVRVDRDRGEYLGTLEVVQDITNLKKIEGEKRLLDWK